MIPVKIFYVLLTIVLMIFSVGYQGTLPVMLLITLYIVAILTAVWSFLARRRISVTLKAGESDLKGGVPYRIHVQNGSLFPITFCEVSLRCVNRFDGEEAKQRVHFTVPPRGAQEMSGMLQTQGAGTYELDCTKVFFTDWFRLFRRKLGTPAPVRFTVWPHAHPIQASLHTIPEEDPTASRVSPDKVGSVPGEFFGVREYREGDRLQYVHWKLTGKTGAFVVKEFSLPRKNSVTLLMEFSGAPDTVIKNAVLDTAATLSALFLEAQVEHELCFLRGGVIHRFEILSRELLYEALRELLSRPPETGTGQPALSALTQPGANRHLVVITGDPQAGEHPVLHGQVVPAALLLVSREDAPAPTSTAGDKLRVLPVCAADVQKSLMGLEL